MATQVAAESTITLNWDPAPRPWIESIVSTTGIAHGYTKAEIRCAAFAKNPYPLTRTDGFWSGRVEFGGNSGVFAVHVDCWNEQGNQYTYDTSITLPSPHSDDELIFKIRREIRRYLAAHPPQKGERGPQGPEGKQGPQGPEGKQGPQGPEGKQGVQGPEGKQGVQGPEGRQGAQGPEGKQGPQGPEGKQGPQGVEGKQGPEGQQGKQGVQGERGEKGEKGDPGSGLALTQRIRKDVSGWKDVGDGTNGPTEWPFYEVHLELDKEYASRDYVVVPTIQGLKPNMAYVRDAYDVSKKKVCVEVYLNPEFYQEGEPSKFAPFTLHADTLGSPAPK